MDQRKIRGLVHKRGDEGQPGCWTWGGAEPSGTAGSSRGRGQEIEETKEMLETKGKA